MRSAGHRRKLGLFNRGPGSQLDDALELNELLQPNPDIENNACIKIALVGKLADRFAFVRQFNPRVTEDAVKLDLAGIKVVPFFLDDISNLRDEMGNKLTKLQINFISISTDPRPFNHYSKQLLRHSDAVLYVNADDSSADDNARYLVQYESLSQACFSNGCQVPARTVTTGKFNMHSFAKLILDTKHNMCHLPEPARRGCAVM